MLITLLIATLLAPSGNGWGSEMGASHGCAERPDLVVSSCSPGVLTGVWTAPETLAPRVVDVTRDTSVDRTQGEPPLDRAAGDAAAPVLASSSLQTPVAASSRLRGRIRAGESSIPPPIAQ